MASANEALMSYKAKHDLELERVKNERELQVGNNEFNVFNVISMLSLFQAL